MNSQADEIRLLYDDANKKGDGKLDMDGQYTLKFTIDGVTIKFWG